ncbi:hypothetical protein NNX28_16935 [Arthrobacter sp. zg-Y859]|uniref:Uncharacterized protein n=1 Tax=Arthrobacter jinronghuae TaxID=2964609 RepID=A0ABT1NV59_9MICC|nr:hypothetical protein [Arthrobacter jinronghuae]MCQ1951605.1 hypothetical protein [Arthrobacter jinronghuae]UWX79681.1 hypothetical protein N2K98_05645 [Arthrobacter jinronghuae]
MPRSIHDNKGSAELRSASTECTATCEAATPDGIHLCPKHARQLTDCLREVPGTWADILTSARKLDVGAGSVGGGGGKASSQEPANLDALDKARTLEVILRGWAEHLGQAAGEPPAVAAWLYVRRDIILRQEWAGDLLQELRDALNDCNRATDRAGQRVFAGMCPTEHEDGTTCEQPLYALTGRPYARCRECGQEWDVSDWRERALAAAEYQHGTAAEISRMLSDPVTREALPQATIRQWARRGKLEAAYCQVADRRNVYRVSDVRDLWAATKAAGYKRARLAA